MEPAKRGRGRPRGSKNKRKGLSHAHVREICDFHKFNPAEKLIAIARNDDWDDDGKRINWPQVAQHRATEKLFDAIHNAKRLPGEIDTDGGAAQITLAFVESDAGLALPGEAGSALAEGVLRPEPLQRAGLSPPNGEDSLRDTETDS